jgi:hypothetical protein
LSRLRRDAEARLLGEREHVRLVEHDVESIEVAGEATNLDVVALPDDHDVVAVSGEGGHGTVCDVDERTGSLDDRQSQRSRARQRPPRRAVRRHHHGRRLHECGIPGDLDASRLENALDVCIVDEIAKDGQRTGVGMLEGEGDCVADAEAHAEVCGAEDTHDFAL